MFNHRFLQNVSAWSDWQSWINVSLCVVCLCFRGHFDILHHTLRRTIRAGGSGLFKWLNSQVLSFQCNKGASDAATDEEADSRRRRNELYAQMMVSRVSLKRQNDFFWLGDTWYPNMTKYDHREDMRMRRPIQGEDEASYTRRWWWALILHCSEHERMSLFAL